MGKEIERKFLVKNKEYRKLSNGIIYKQGYINCTSGTNVRVRTIGNETAFVTIKGKKKDITRDEYEYAIPIKEAEEMLKNICDSPIIIKTRYIYEYKGFYWEIDEFHGENEGLVVAEIELKSEDEKFEKPDWIDKEVTSDNKYYNSNLLKYPYSKWK